MSNKQILENLTKQALSAISAATDEGALLLAEKQYLGRRGGLSQILHTLKDLPLQKKRSLGSLANQSRQAILLAIKVKKQNLAGAGVAVDFDLTEPGAKFPAGHVHPLTQVRQDIETFFRSYGFSVLEGPEIETDYYNFEALNIPPDHPARDIWDTFWIKSKQNLLLRTHTSPMQVRVMEKQKPPLAVLVPGRTFRHEATDARHEHTFDQVEGFYVSRDASAAHLKYILHNLFRDLFGEKVGIKLRPGYFPFTEPSFELVMSCPFCHARGCKVCGSGWLEMLGAGMIHPRVFEAAGYKPREWRGFAFGMGIARVAMLRYNIPDIRMFYQNDLRVLGQF